MTKYNQTWAQINQPVKKSIQLIPMLIVALATLAIIVLQLINNCGGFLL